MVQLPDAWRSATLHVEIAGLLCRNGLKTSQLDGYAVASGPGTFTGLRIGLTAVKALAEVHRKLVVPVSSLELLAVAARNTLPSSFSGSIAALLDARRGQIFGALFHVQGSALVPLIPDCVCSLQQFLERVRASNPQDARFCATEPETFEEQLQASGWGGHGLLTISPALAGTLAQIGLERLRLGEGVSPEAAGANYVRPSDAELFWKG
jgi:tRNA threonylcarbamoyladenosine biosynthesis protein TsaB